MSDTHSPRDKELVDKLSFIFVTLRNVLALIDSQPTCCATEEMVNQLALCRNLSEDGLRAIAAWNEPAVLPPQDAVARQVAEHERRRHSIMFAASIMDETFPKVATPSTFRR